MLFVFILSVALLCPVLSKNGANVSKNPKPDALKNVIYNTGKWGVSILNKRKAKGFS